MKKFRKKGSVEIQLNWIYVAVVGGMILLLFVNIAFGIRKSAKERMEYEAIQYFDEIFTSMQGSENTEHSITLPGMDIEVDSAETGEDQCNYYKISNSNKQGQEITYLPIFSPNLIKQKVLSYSLGWDMPFRANYFLYLSSPQTAYVLVNDNSNLYDDLPNHLNKKAVESSATFVNQNYYKIKFIFFNEEPGTISKSVSKVKDKDVSAINIIPESDIYGFGKVKFYTKKGETFVDQGTGYYLDKPTLFGAIYTESYDAYQCNLIKAIDRINKVSKLLKDRVGMIKNSYLLSMCLMSYYDQAYDMLGQVEAQTSELKADESGMRNLYSIKNQLQSLNTEINRKSCPTIY